MKKLGIILVAILVIFVSGCSNKLTTYTSINYNDFVGKKDNKDTFALVLGSSTCSACALFKPVMEEFISEYQVEVFYIDISTLSDDEYNKLKSEITFSGTPTTVFYQDGVLTSFYNRLDGAENINAVINIFKQNGYIK